MAVTQGQQGQHQLEKNLPCYKGNHKGSQTTQQKGKHLWLVALTILLECPVLTSSVGTFKIKQVNVSDGLLFILKAELLFV